MSVTKVRITKNTMRRTFCGYQISMEYWIYVCKKNEKRKKQNTGKSDIANPKEQRCRISQNVLEHGL